LVSIFSQTDGFLQISLLANAWQSCIGIMHRR
jgi:hypothetical protein